MGFGNGVDIELAGLPEDPRDAAADELVTPPQRQGPGLVERPPASPPAQSAFPLVVPTSVDVTRPETQHQFVPDIKKPVPRPQPVPQPIWGGPWEVPADLPRPILDPGIFHPHGHPRAFRHMIVDTRTDLPEAKDTGTGVIAQVRDLDQWWYTHLNVSDDIDSLAWKQLTNTGGVAGENGNGNGGGAEGFSAIAYNTLTTIQLSFTDLPGCSILVPDAGTYIIQGNFAVDCTLDVTPTGTPVILAGKLVAVGSTPTPSFIGRISLPIWENNIELTFSQTWIVTTTGPETFKLQMIKTASTTGVFQSRSGASSMTIYAAGTTVLGGGGGDHKLLGAEHQDVDGVPLANDLLKFDGVGWAPEQVDAHGDHHQKFEGMFFANEFVAPNGSGVMAVAAGVGIELDRINPVIGRITHASADIGDVHPNYQRESQANSVGGYGPFIGEVYLAQFAEAQTFTP